jgi:hypothetical protein
MVYSVASVGMNLNTGYLKKQTTFAFGQFITISGRFFANYTNIFHKIFKMAIFSKFFGDVIILIIRVNADKSILIFFQLKILNILLSVF